MLSDLRALDGDEDIASALYECFDKELHDETVLARFVDRERDKFLSYYDRRLRNPEFSRSMYEPKLVELIKVIRAQNALGRRATLLDVACGLGSQSLAAGFLGANVVGVDLDDLSLDVARRRHQLYQDQLGESLQVRFQSADATRLGELALGDVDVVFTQQAVSMFHPIDAFLRGAWECLRPGGTLILTDGNLLHPLAVLRYVSRKLRRTEFTDHRPLTPSEMRQRFQQIGYRVDKLATYGHLPPVAFDAIPGVSRFTHAVERQLVQAPSAKWTGVTYMIVGVKPSVDSPSDSVGSSSG